MTDFWIGSTEYRRWWDGEPARVVGPVASDGALGLDLTLVELERSGDRVLMGRSIPVPVRPGTAVGVRIFDPPDDWDGTAPIAQRSLVGFSEPELYARPEELPVVSEERRERIRRGWGF
jgi:hypothetical protein